MAILFSVIVVGLDNSGKTTLLYNVKDNVKKLLAIFIYYNKNFLY